MPFGKGINNLIIDGKSPFYFTGQLTVLSCLGGSAALGIDYRVGWACFGAGGALKAGPCQ